MNVIIIGAGASGVTAAINYKRNHQLDEVLIIEQLEKPLKKLLATGNGKCNLGNANLNVNRFKNNNYVEPIISEFNYKNFFESISIKTKLIGDLAYPVSESAVSVREAFLKELRKLKIKLNVEEKLIDYCLVENKITVITSKNQYTCDKLYLAGGLKSSPKLGSDGSIFEILKRHNYKINEINPGLCPIYTIEKTKELDGIRVKANVKLIVDDYCVHEEFGEVLFKEHGLSGIVIFNIMSVIARNIKNKYKISIDLLPDFSISDLNQFLSNHTLDEFLLAFINPKLANYIKSQINTKNIIDVVKNLEFTFDKPYGFEYSQVSVGGVCFNSVDNNLMSKSENNVYIIGELLDVDGPCGGYNLTWAFASAIKGTTLK